VRAYRRLFWVFIVLLIALLCGETYLLRSLIPSLQQSMVVLILISSVLVVEIASGYLEWRFTELEEVPPDGQE